MLVRTLSNYQSIPQSNDQLRIISWNISADYHDKRDPTPDQRYHWKNRSKYVLELINQMTADIICLQEMSPDQAVTIATVLQNQGYSARFLSQTPSDIQAGLIVDQNEVKSWCGKSNFGLTTKASLALAGKFIGTALIGIFTKGEFKETGRFWLNENCDDIPCNMDRSLTDKGFGNMNTYRAVLWAKINIGNRIVYVFNSHYPLSGTTTTRMHCAKLERYQINAIAGSNFWISTGDRNFVPDTIDPQIAYDALVAGCYDIRDCCNHYGPDITWLGFSYDKLINNIANDNFTGDYVIDVMISNQKAIRSFHHHTAYNPITRRLIDLADGVDDKMGIERYFASDHAMIGADFDITVPVNCNDK